MELERWRIERSDFAVARRGYEQSEVDGHLREVADAVERLDRTPRTQTVASAAADQVRGIVEAAERSAAELRESAERDAARTRERAEAEASEQLGRVQAAVTEMLERADALERELGALVDRVRGGAEGLVASLRSGADETTARIESLRAELAELAPGQGVTGADPEPAEPVEEHAEPGDAEPEAGDAEPERERAEPVAAHAEPAESGSPPVEAAQESPAEAAYRAAPEQAVAEHPGRESNGNEGARLIALNMALDGKPREETARYLRENFDLEDPDGILEEAYYRAAG